MHIILFSSVLILKCFCIKVAILNPQTDKGIYFTTHELSRRKKLVVGMQVIGTCYNKYKTANQWQKCAPLVHWVW